jgi:hypothetical protein
MVTATIKRRSPTIGVKINNSTGSIQTTTPVTIQTNITPAVIYRLDSLADVVEQSPQSGDTLVYDANTDTYVVTRLNLQDVIGDLDGGTF